MQDVAAGKKFESEKHPGNHNAADMCTKHVDRDLSEKHCRYTNCDFHHEESSQGLSFHALVANEIEVKTSLREDMQSVHLRRPHKGGPNMRDVIGRRTADMESGNIILEEKQSDIVSKNPNMPYFSTPRDIRIVLLYIARQEIISGGSSSGHTSSHTPSSRITRST